MMDEERNSQELAEAQGEHTSNLEPRSVATVAEGDTQELEEEQGVGNSTQGSRKETPKQKSGLVGSTGKAGTSHFEPRTLQACTSGR